MAAYLPISITALDVGFDLREHRMAARLPSTGYLSVRCHPLGTTEQVVTVEGPAAEVWAALKARGYDVAAPIDTPTEAFHRDLVLVDQVAAAAAPLLADQTIRPYAPSLK